MQIRVEDLSITRNRWGILSAAVFHEGKFAFTNGTCTLLRQKDLYNGFGLTPISK